MGRRTVLLIVAVVIAALGTTAVLVYVKGVNDRALKNQSPEQVLVAKDRIPAGTVASDAEKRGLLKLQTVPRDAVAATALNSIAPISDLVALSDIYAGEQILSVKFGQPGAVSALPLPAGAIGLSVQLGDPQRVAGFVKPGSQVAIFVTVDNTSAATSTNGVPNGTKFTKLLIARVGVIAVGPTTTRPTGTGAPNAQNTETVPTAILTLAVNQKQAEQIILGQEVGSLYFGLLSPDSKVGGGTAIQLGTLFK